MNFTCVGTAAPGCPVERSSTGLGRLSFSQLPQPLPCFIESRVLFAKRKSHLLRPILWIVVETRSRNRCHTNFFHQIFRERDIIREPKRTDVRHHVVRPTRTKAPESRLLQSRYQTIPSRTVSISEIFVISTRQTQSSRASLLQRSRSTHGKKIMNFANRICDRRRRHRPPHPPSCHAVTLRQTINRDRSLAHTFEARHRNVLRAVVKNMLVDLIRDGQNVELNTQIANQFQFAACENLASRIVGRVENYRFGPMMKSRTQLALIKRPFTVGCNRWTQLHEYRLRAGQHRVRPVILVKRFEDHHLVALVANRQQRRNHGLGRTTTHRDLRLWINRDPLPFLHLPGNCIPQTLRAPCNRVLIDVRGNCFLRGSLDLGRSRKIRKALRQVNRTMQHGLPRHLADDGLSKMLNFVAKKMLRLENHISHNWLRLAQDNPPRTRREDALVRPAEQSSAI